MLKIQRSQDVGVVLSLSGRIEMEDVAELQRLLRLEVAGRAIALDLQDITLVDRDAVKFLAHCQAESIELENCPAYIRQWIVAGKRPKQPAKALNGQPEQPKGRPARADQSERGEDCNGFQWSSFFAAAVQRSPLG
jgi:hypothetical protein